MTYHESLPAGSRPLKVAMISHSDMLGGASVVTYRTYESALKAEGVDARMSVYNRTDRRCFGQAGWNCGNARSALRMGARAHHGRKRIPPR